MLMNAIRILVFELFLEAFYGLMVKQLNFCFYISYENNVKSFPNIVN